jgi:hypothetical protein
MLENRFFYPVSMLGRSAWWSSGRGGFDAGKLGSSFRRRDASHLPHARRADTTSAVGVATTWMSDPFVGMSAITRVDAQNLKSICHPTTLKTPGTIKQKRF